MGKLYFNWEREAIMNYIKIKCNNCNKDLFILEPYARNKMFCTIDCMEKKANDEHSDFQS